MEALTRFGLEKSRLTILVMIGLLIAGSLTYLNIPKRENPAITVRTAIVAAQFPGMAPERVEDLIAVPLERAAREIGDTADRVDQVLRRVIGILDQPRRQRRRDPYPDADNTR